MSLTEVEKSILAKGWSCPLPPKQLTYSDYLYNIELFSRSIDNLKTKINDAVLTSFCNYNANARQQRSNEEFEAVKALSTNCNLVIQIKAIQLL